MRVDNGLNVICLRDIRDIRDRKGFDMAGFDDERNK